MGKSKAIIPIIILAVLVIGVIGLVWVFPLQNQSVLGLSSVYLQGGKVFWLFTGSANDLNEQVTFTYPTPNQYIKPDGTEVQPQEGLRITYSKEESSCTYRVTRRTRGFLIFTWEYYILNNPEKIVRIKFQDGNGRSTIMDATVIDSKTIQDSDGSGSVTIQTQGLLGGKVQCPNYENVAIYMENGQPRIVYKDQLENRIQTAFTGTLLNFLFNLQNQVSTNTQFINAFDGPIGFDGNEVLGFSDLIGSGVFTITADQDYFDSVIYTPPANVDPRIDDILIPSQIQADSTQSMRVDISNREDNAGNVRISASSSQFAIDPSSINKILNDEISVSFNVKASNQPKNYQIDVEVCSTPQFGAANCDSETVSGEIIGGTANQYCGDNICQANENFNTCPQDCPNDGGSGDDPLDCESCSAWLWSQISSNPENECSEGVSFDSSEGQPWYSPGKWFGVRITQGQWCPIYFVALISVIIFFLVLVISLLWYLNKTKGKQKK